MSEAPHDSQLTQMGPPLTPLGLDTLLARIGHEWATRKRIFDLPTARFWRPDDEVDLTFEFLGRPAATPIGPAAGPHSQLAQNIVLAWLGGSRLFELKTVQVLDELEIARPCIDMETIGYNIEWSQELSVAQSLEEYVTAAMLLRVLENWEPLHPFVGTEPGPRVFDMSVGYDLAGIAGPKVAGFIDGMRNATSIIDKLRPRIGGVFAPLRDLEFDPVISDTVTLSTFHGCPPDEIEAITKHLIDAHDLDVIVKLNPTLLGYRSVVDIVNDRLGYHDVSVKQEAFDQDLQFATGVELIGRLADYAKTRGRRFGIKTTNTLVVDNTRGIMPDDTMYLSGPPLHVLAVTLVDRLDEALAGRLELPGSDGDIMVSFSAGVTRDNLADTIAAGLNPATICSDLLKPGGYGRLAPMLRTLTTAMAEAGVTDLTSFRAAGHRAAIQAGYRSAVAQQAARVVSDEQHGLYHRDGNEKLPRSVDRDLEMFGCAACNLCVTVCPNDAFFTSPSLDGMDDRQQYLVLAELCNECGNCLTFCPERGDPAMIKPRLFTDPALFEGRTGQGFLVADGRVISARSDTDSSTTTSLAEGDAAVVDALLATKAGNPLGRTTTGPDR